jgi:GT2 family glycosyltransferase
MVENEFPQVELIKNEDNLGFSKANNQGLKIAKGRYVLLLNPDMKVFSDTLSNMVKWMDENPQASVAGCNLITETGETIKHVRRFPQVWDQLAIALKLPHLFPGLLDKYLCDDFDYIKAAKVDSVRGGFFMIRNETLKSESSLRGVYATKQTYLINEENRSPRSLKPLAMTNKLNDANNGFFTLPFLDERYFIWFEEVDYCRQISKMGGEVWYTPSAKCIDYVGQSFKQVKRVKTQKYFRESMLKYFKKWHPGWQYIILWKAWFFGRSIAWIADKLKVESKAKT